MGPTCYIFARKEVPDSRDHVGRSVRSVVILVVVEARTCRSRGTHVACTGTYSGQGARKKIRPRMRTYGRGLERLVTHTYGEGSCSWGGNKMRRVHGEATECVVFMGRQRNASCSSGGNGTRGSQPAGSERNTSSCSSGGLGRNIRWKRGLAYRRMEETALCLTGHGRNGIQIGRAHV